MNMGFIQLDRTILDTPIFDNPKLLKIWIWCLCKATFKERETVIGLQTVKLYKGQFIFGKLSASDALNMNPTTFYKSMKLLEEMGLITIKATKKFSIASIIEWDCYAGGKGKGAAQWGAGYHKGKEETEANLKQIVKDIIAEEGDSDGE